DEPTLIGREYTVGSEKDVSSLLGQVCALTTVSEKEYYKCVRKLPAGYSSLGVELKKEYLPNKDTLFSFSSPSVKYTFARQNRPPALDYISRLSCPAGEYDYLAIQDEEGALGTIDITTMARDPDEQAPLTNVVADSSTLLIDGDNSPGRFFQENPPVGRYNLIATASDGILQDSQSVRILVDNPIKSTIDVHHKYDNLPLRSEGGLVLVSPEDEIVVNVDLPERSLSGNLGEFHFSLSNSLRSILLGLIPLEDSQFAEQREYTFEFPLGFKGKKDKIKEMDDVSQFEYAPFVDVGTPSTLTLQYEINYCGKYAQTSESKVAIAISPCLPHRNADHPFPYPYQNYVDKNKDGTADIDSTGDLTKEPIDPFLAGHACCLADREKPQLPQTWVIASAESKTVCFQKLVEGNGLGCFGDTNSAGKGYLLEKRITETVYCDGTRGNTCESQPQYVDTVPQNKCGSKKQTQCTEVASECQGLEPFSKGDGFWCNGEAGCGEEKEACTSEIMTNVKGLDFANLNDEQYDCGCDSKKFNGGDLQKNIDNPCFSLKENKVGTCQEKGTFFKKYYCSVAS
ncbi:hypothetical protein HY496_01455, partial [Candidatus Woesearchaeota archaeon]|nr:hypothetical protein [Candidatus Woesearchaeota archaeon]